VGTHFEQALNFIIHFLVVTSPELKPDRMRIDVDTTPGGPRKRPRSASITLAPGPNPHFGTNGEVPAHVLRQPKRQRKSKDVPEYSSPPDDHVLKRMERGNPMSRKNLKKEAKRAKKAHRVKSNQGSGGGGMEVDDVGLQCTFMA